MTISLSENEASYLLPLLTKQSPWWVRDKIIANIITEQKKEDETKKCKHNSTTYIHKTIACQRCGFVTEISDTRQDFSKE